MTNIVRTTTLSVLIALSLLAVNASAAFAAKPLNLHIEVDDIIGGSGETFLASGPAVNAGAVCATGTEDDISVVDTAPPSAPFAILHVLKRFTCADASGTFDVRMVVRLNRSTGETRARWLIVDGTGDYAGLRGRGTLVGTPIVLGTSIHDVYNGRVH